MVFVIGGVILLLGGLITGLALGSRNNMGFVGPSVAGLLALSTGIAHVLTRWVLRVDPHRDVGYIPLPWPWDSLLGLFAVALPLASPVAIGALGGLLAWDFVARCPSKWIRAAMYVAVLAFLTIDGFWVLGIVAD